MDNVTQHMSMYTSIDSVHGHGWVTFTQGLVQAIVRDMTVLKQEVTDEAALAAATTQAPVSKLHAEVFGHKGFKPKDFSGDKSSEISYAQLRMDILKFVKYTDPAVHVMMQALDRCEPPLDVTRIAHEMDDLDDAVPHEEADIRTYGIFLQDLMTSMTTGEARVAVENEHGREFGGLASWMKLRTLFFFYTVSNGAFWKSRIRSVHFRDQRSWRGRSKLKRTS